MANKEHLVNKSSVNKLACASNEARVEAAVMLQTEIAVSIH